MIIKCLKTKFRYDLCFLKVGKIINAVINEGSYFILLVATKKPRKQQDEDMPFHLLLKIILKTLKDIAT